METIIKNVKVVYESDSIILLTNNFETANEVLLDIIECKKPVCLDLVHILTKCFIGASPKFIKTLSFSEKLSLFRKGLSYVNYEKIITGDSKNDYYEIKPLEWIKIDDTEIYIHKGTEYDNWWGYSCMESFKILINEDDRHIELWNALSKLHLSPYKVAFAKFLYDYYTPETYDLAIVEVHNLDIDIVIKVVDRVITNLKYK